jgi:hypothetical protein
VLSELQTELSAVALSEAQRQLQHAKEQQQSNDGSGQDH